MRATLLRLLFLLTPAVICLRLANASDTSEELLVSFTLYDNGSSENGINVTLSPSEFREIPDEPGLAFAMDMSKLIDVSKYNAEEPVIATKAFREDGELITSFPQLFPNNNDQDTESKPRRVYLVAEGLDFIWPFVSRHHMQEVSASVLPPVESLGLPVIIESLSETPRVFHVHNLFTVDEADSIIDYSLSLTGDDALQRSTVGSGKDETGEDMRLTDSGRTSQNSWDWKSPAALAMVTRSFQLTNIEEDTGKRDGLQVVRYHEGEGYNTHPDYFEKDADEDFDFYPYSGGSNRFATVFMYLNEVEEGGFTVFPEAPGIIPARDPPPGALEMFEPHSWQHSVTKRCYNRLAVPPKVGTAALFYSITPDGRIDHKSLHGACPVTKGIKWGANIWLWNKQRYGDIRTGDERALEIVNETDDVVYISWERKASAQVEPGQTSSMNSYEFHRFQAHFGSHMDKSFDQFTVQSQPENQIWVIKQAKVHVSDSSSSGSAMEDEL